MALVERRRAAADAGLAQALHGAIHALEPLRGVWEPAFEAHRTARTELQALDPAYETRTLRTVKTASGLTVNDRSDPAVDAMLQLMEAQQQHEAHWRGEIVMRVPDFDDASVAHNAVLWGYRNRDYGSGAEVGVATAFAARAAWRDLIPEESVPHLQRIMASLLRFLWGQQKVQHLEHWMMSAHREVIALAIERVRSSWAPPESSIALQETRALSTAIDHAFAAPAGGSKFAQVRAALQSSDSVAPALVELRDEIEATIHRLHRLDPYAAADFGAWILGDLLTRIHAASAGPDGWREVALGCSSLYEAFESKQEGWFMPYLMDGFKEVRESGGQDLFAQWSGSVL
ncbi:MAG: hypothetical protein ABIZ91_01565 [Gemmatimonadaceae bacterium]